MPPASANAAAERDVHRPADLLVEEDVAREAVDLVVEAERNLAEHLRARIGVEQRAQVFLPQRRLRVDDRSILEPEAHVLDLPPLEDRREREEDLAARPGLDRARVDLAVGHVVLPVRWDPAAPFDDEEQVGAGAGDPQLAHALELARPGAERLGHGAPVRDRVVAFTRVAGAVDEILVLGERHFGVLGVRLRRVERRRTRRGRPTLIRSQRLFSIR